jgi:hypothetical protein
MDRCRIEILGIDDKVTNTIDVDPIYSEEAINERRVHTVTYTNTNRHKKTLVPQLLLHQRLGHRHTSTLLMVDEDNIWADTTIAKDEDRFCETCRLTTARKANKGNQYWKIWMILSRDQSLWSTLWPIQRIIYHRCNIFSILLGDYRCRISTVRAAWTTNQVSRISVRSIARLGYIVWTQHPIQHVNAHPYPWRL